MKNLMLFEDFTKDFEQKISTDQFKSIKVGSEILYYGVPYKVLANDGYVLTLKDQKNREFMVNLNMFNAKGAIR
jgi:hypothetical protein